MYVAVHKYVLKPADYDLVQKNLISMEKSCILIWWNENQSTEGEAQVLYETEDELISIIFLRTTVNLR